MRTNSPSAPTTGGCSARNFSQRKPRSSSCCCSGSQVCWYQPRQFSMASQNCMSVFSTSWPISLEGGEPREAILDLCCLDELAPSLVSEQGEGAKFAAIFKMDEDFASDAFLILKRMFLRKLRAEFEERFLSVGGFAVNAADEANQLVPGLAVRVTVFAGVNSGELPLVFSGKRIDRLGQAGSEGFQLIGRTLSRAGLPEIGTQVEVFHTEASALADGAFEVFGAWKIVELGEVAGKFGFVLARNGDIGAVKVGQFTRRQRQRSHRGDRAGNPAERVLFLGDFASGV